MQFWGQMKSFETLLPFDSGTKNFLAHNCESLCVRVSPDRYSVDSIGGQLNLFVEPWVSCSRDRRLPQPRISSFRSVSTGEANWYYFPEESGPQIQDTAFILWIYFMGCCVSASNQSVDPDADRPVSLTRPSKRTYVLLWLKIHQISLFASKFCEFLLPEAWKYQNIWISSVAFELFHLFLWAPTFSLLLTSLTRGFCDPIGITSWFYLVLLAAGNHLLGIALLYEFLSLPTIFSDLLTFPGGFYIKEGTEAILAPNALVAFLPSFFSFSAIPFIFVHSYLYSIRNWYSCSLSRRMENSLSRFNQRWRRCVHFSIKPQTFLFQRKRRDFHVPFFHTSLVWFAASRATTPARLWPQTALINAQFQIFSKTFHFQSKERGRIH